MLKVIIGIYLATYAYRCGVRPRAGESPASLFAGRYGRVFAAFVLLLGIGIAALSLKPDWAWGSDLALGAAVWFWVMHTGFQRAETTLDGVSSAVGQAVESDRWAFGVAAAIWLAIGFVVPTLVLNAVFPDAPFYADATVLFGLLYWVIYLFALPLFQKLVARILFRKRVPRS
jgi:hypothetical protein